MQLSSIVFVSYFAGVLIFSDIFFGSASFKFGSYCLLSLPLNVFPVNQLQTHHQMAANNTKLLILRSTSDEIEQLQPFVEELCQWANCNNAVYDRLRLSLSE